jgi:hypothetical protein
MAALWGGALGLWACLDLSALQGGFTASDLGAVDLAGLPPAADAAPADLGAVGCRFGRGVGLGSGWACPGLYNAIPGDATPAASDLCAPGFAICTSAAAIDLSRCAALPGFFASAVAMRRPRLSADPADIACGTASGSDAALFAGCGAGAAGETLYRPATPCSGFAVAIDCTVSSSISCGPAPDLSTAAQYRSDSGILCCPR